MHTYTLIFSEDDVEATQKEMHSVLTTFNDEWEMVHDLKKAHQKSYVEYVAKMLRARVEEEEQEKSSSVAEKITAAFLALDEDMSKEGIDYAGDDEVGLMTSTVALSGAVAVVAHVEGPHLHIASCGDCVAVLGTWAHSVMLADMWVVVPLFLLGSLSENDTWIAKKITTDHNTDNQKEIQRIMEKHPGEQKRSIFQGDRLLGMLAPLRAFGDFRFKWKAEVIEKTIGNMLGQVAVPKYYKNPPYLSVEPDLFSHRLSPKDKFLVIGSDGLWVVFKRTFG